MADNAMVTLPILESLPNRLARAVAAVRERLARFARSRPSDAATRSDVVAVGSIVRVFAVDALRDVTLILAPAGSSRTTPGMVAADSPIATALMGGRVGETRRWESSSGSRRLQIIEIIGRLPEAAWTPSKQLRPTPVVNATPFREAGRREPGVVPLPAAA